MDVVDKTPLRRCIGCGKMRPKRELLRIVKKPNGMIHVDRTGKSQGRGAYICKEADCLSEAVRRKGLERSYKMAITSELYISLREEIAAD